MKTSKEVNKLVKAYAKRVRPTLITNIKKNGKMRVIERAYYHGYFEALRQFNIIETLDKEIK